MSGSSRKRYLIAPSMHLSLSWNAPSGVAQPPLANLHCIAHFYLARDLLHPAAAGSDAIRFVQSVRVRGFPLAVASSSRNANQMMQVIRLDSGQSLLEAFSS